MNAVDFFCGGGGASCGLRQAKVQVLAAIDINKDAAKTYCANFPHVKFFNQDIRTLDEYYFLKEINTDHVDLFVACPPCQGFSSMGFFNYKHITGDPRNDLILECRRFIDVLNPTVILIENVPLFARAKEFLTFLFWLREKNYNVTHSVLNSSHYGIPQHRHRLILLASRRYVLRFPRPSYKIKTAFETIGHLPPPGKGDDPLHDYQIHHSQHALKAIKRVPIDGGALDPKNKMRYTRMFKNDASTTITANFNNVTARRMLHYEQDRLITLREAALLQTFPMNYIFPTINNRQSVARIIGESVPPLLIKKLVLQIQRDMAIQDGFRSC